MDKNQKIFKQFDLEVKETNKEKREVTVIGSVQQVDRDKDIVDIKTMNLQNFKSNPVVLWSHRSGDLPIAKALNVTKAGKNSQLKFKLQFAKKDEYEFADTVYKLVKGGYINASSIGFKIDWEKSERNSERGGYDFKNTELLELSLVNVPANQGALITQRQYKDFCEDDTEFDKFKENFIKDNQEETTKPETDLEQNKNDILVDFQGQLDRIELQLDEIKSKVISANLKNQTGTYVDDLFSNLVDELDAKSKGSSNSKGKIEESDLDEIINKLNEEK